MNVSSLLRITAARGGFLSARCHIFSRPTQRRGLRSMVAKASDTNGFAMRWRMGHRYAAVSRPTDITVSIKRSWHRNEEHPANGRGYRFWLIDHDLDGPVTIRSPGRWPDTARSAAQASEAHVRTVGVMGPTFRANRSHPSGVQNEKRPRHQTGAFRAGRARDAYAACGTRSERTRPPISTISATRPSPRMVAPDTPLIRR